MTSLFSSSWMCRQCGREACSACFSTVRTLTQDLPLTSTPQQRTEMLAKRDRHAQRNPFFLSCNRRNEHTLGSFSPVTRFAPGELEAAVVAMEEILPDEEQSINTSTTVSPISAVERPGAEASTSTRVPAAGAAAVGASSSAAFSEGGPDGSDSMFSVTVAEPWLSEGAKCIVSDPRPPSYVPSSDDPPQTPTWPIAYFEDSALTEERFARLWAKGAPLVVTDLSKKFHLEWTPEYFMTTYGQQNCIILHCQRDANKRVTVGEFFSWFGKFEGRTDCWKLKVCLSVLVNIRPLMILSMSRIGLRRLTSSRRFPNCMMTSVVLCPLQIMHAEMVS